MRKTSFESWRRGVCRLHTRSRAQSRRAAGRVGTSLVAECALEHCSTPNPGPRRLTSTDLHQAGLLAWGGVSGGGCLALRAARAWEQPRGGRQGSEETCCRRLRCLRSVQQERAGRPRSRLWARTFAPRKLPSPAILRFIQTCLARYRRAKSVEQSFAVAVPVGPPLPPASALALRAAAPPLALPLPCQTLPMPSHGKAPRPPS